MTFCIPNTLTRMGKAFQTLIYEKKQVGLLQSERALRPAVNADFVMSAAAFQDGS